MNGVSLFLVLNAVVLLLTPAHAAHVCGDPSTFTPSPGTCDDGNLEKGDGCSPTCQIEPGWWCDASAGQPSWCCPQFQKRNACGECVPEALAGRCTACGTEGSCPGMCQCSGGHEGRICDSCKAGYTMDKHYTCHPVIGDGIITPDEQCDDGNAVDGDGCDHRGRLEPGHTSTTLACEGCNGHGKCDNGTCVCDQGWYGQTCTTYCGVSSCGVHGACDTNTGLCVCHPGFWGAACETEYPSDTTYCQIKASSAFRTDVEMCLQSSLPKNVRVAVLHTTNPDSVKTTKPYRHIVAFDPPTENGRVVMQPPLGAAQKAVVPNGIHVRPATHLGTQPGSWELHNLDFRVHTEQCSGGMLPIIDIESSACEISLLNVTISRHNSHCTPDGPLIRIRALRARARVMLGSVTIGPGYRHGTGRGVSVDVSFANGGSFTMVDGRFHDVSDTALKVTGASNAHITSTTIDAVLGATSPVLGTVFIEKVADTLVFEDNDIHVTSYSRPSNTALMLDTAPTAGVHHNRISNSFHVAVWVQHRHASTNALNLRKDDLRALCENNPHMQGQTHDMILGSSITYPTLVCDDGCYDASPSPTPQAQPAGT